MLAGCLPRASQTPHPQRRGGHQTSHQRMLPMHSSSQTLSHGGPSRLEDPRLTRGVAKNKKVMFLLSTNQAKLMSAQMDRPASCGQQMWRITLEISLFLTPNISRRAPSPDLPRRELSIAHSFVFGCKLLTAPPRAA